MSPNWLKKPLKHQFLTATQGKEIDLAVLTKRKMTWLTSLAEVSTMKDWEREKRPQGKYFEICPGNASEMWNSDNWERRIFPLFPPQYLRRILLNPHLFKVFKCSNKTDNIMGRAAGIASLTFFFFKLFSLTLASSFLTTMGILSSGNLPTTRLATSGATAPVLYGSTWSRSSSRE